MFGSALALALRLALALLVLALGWRGVALLRARRPHDIQHLDWLPDGRWRLRERGGRERYVEPGPPRRLGALLWLRWRAEGQHRLLIVDGAVVEPNQWRRLKARLKLNRS